jgi:HlyD family secretion protein
MVALRKQNLVAQADADTAQANADANQAAVAAAEGAVEQAKASLHQAQINLNYATIISPIDGVVISRNVDVGQTVASALQAPTLFTIAEDLRKMQVDTNVAEADVGKLSSGMMASFEVDAYPGVRFKGRVRQIRNAPQSVQNVVTYDAVIDVDNSDLRLKPGMTANVTFTYAEKQDVLKVPNAALRFRPPPDVAQLAGRPGKGKGKDKENDGKRTVWVLRGAQLAPVLVRTGLTDGSLTEITEGGVREGELVVTEVITKPGANAPPAMRRGF